MEGDTATGSAPAAAELLTVPDAPLILAAIEQSRTSLLVRIDHLFEECNLIMNDLDKIRGRMKESDTCLK